MPFDHITLIDSFKAIDSLSDEAKEKLTSLVDSLRFVAPELIVERLFCDFKSQQGLMSILNEHARDNDEAYNLYTEALANVEKT